MERTHRAERPDRLHIALGEIIKLGSIRQVSNKVSRLRTRITLYRQGSNRSRFSISTGNGRYVCSSDTRSFLGCSAGRGDHLAQLSLFIESPSALPRCRRYTGWVPQASSPKSLDRQQLAQTDSLILDLRHNDCFSYYI